MELEQGQGLSREVPASSKLPLSIHILLPFIPPDVEVCFPLRTGVTVMTSANAGNGFCPQGVTVDNYLCWYIRTACFPASLKERKLLLLFIQTLDSHYPGFLFRMRCSYVILWMTFFFSEFLFSS